MHIYWIGSNLLNNGLVQLDSFTDSYWYSLIDFIKEKLYLNVSASIANTTGTLVLKVTIACCTAKERGPPQTKGLTPRRFSASNVKNDVVVYVRKKIMIKSFCYIKGWSRGWVFPLYPRTVSIKS